MTDIESVRQSAFKRIAKALREFGYPDVTHKNVAAWFDEWKRSVPATDVCAMIAVKEFENPDNYRLFGEPDGQQQEPQ